MNLLAPLFPIAYAQVAPGSAQAVGSSPWTSLLLFGGMFLLFYVLLWRPQAKRAKEHRELVGGISKGDEVMTSGGLLGKVTKVSDDYMTVQVAEGVELKLQKSSVAAALPKGTINQI